MVLRLALRVRLLLSCTGDVADFEHPEAETYGSYIPIISIASKDLVLRSIFQQNLCQKILSFSFFDLNNATVKRDEDKSRYPILNYNNLRRTTSSVVSCSTGVAIFQVRKPFNESLIQDDTIQE